MSLTNNWYQLLNVLLVKRRVDVRDLSDLTHLSVPTLKKNIDLLNGQMTDIAFIDKTSKIIELHIYDVASFRTIMSGSLKEDTDFNSQGKRIAFCLKQLIKKNDFIMIDDLADELQVSRGTVNKDLKLIKQNIESYGVSLKGIPNKGIKLIGDEFNFRLILLKYVYDYYRSEFNLSNVTKEWIGRLAKFYKLDQSTVILLEKVIALSLKRILIAKPMTMPISYYNNFEYRTPIMQDFMIHLEKEYELTLSKYDQDFISFPINTRTTAMVTDDCMNNYEPEVRAVFDDMMDEVTQSFVTDINRDDLFDVLKYHLMFMLNRIIFHLDLVDLFMAEIQEKYPFSFEMAKVAVSILETKLMMPINEIEISYLTIYFELVIHKKKETQAERKVAVVCSTGRGTAALIHRQLSEVLGPDITIVQYSESEYQELDVTQFIAIFSTLPLPARNNKPVIQITDLFNQQLLLQKWKEVDEQLLLNGADVDFSFERLDSNKSYIANVRGMVRTLIDEKKLDPTFLPLWEEREQRQTTIFDQGIGFPHTINKSSSTIIFRVGVFENAIKEEGQTVEIVFLVGIPEYISSSVEKTLMEVYDLIFLIGQNKEFVSKIKTFETDQELLDFIEKEEVI